VRDRRWRAEVIILALARLEVLCLDLVSSVQLAGRLGYAGSYTIVGAPHLRLWKPQRWRRGTPSWRPVG
jgi:hypothetical protein